MFKFFLCALSSVTMMGMAVSAAHTQGDAAILAHSNTQGPGAVHVENHDLRGKRIRPCQAGQNTAAYFQYTTADSEDALVSAHCEFAQRVELHDHIEIQPNVYKMVRVDAIAPHEGVIHLKPGGKHVMLFGMARALKEGEQLPLTLVFKKSGRVEQMFAVQHPAS